jgi:DNA polymerase III epsilon subunit-like protein
MKDVMVDIETLSTRNNASIMTIGAIKFDSSSVLDIDDADKFYMRVDYKSNEGRHIDINTVAWWMDQEPKAKNEIIDKNDRFPLEEVLTKFNKWFEGSTFLWSHGATFDIPIIQGAMDECGIQSNWKFYNCRDTRTLYDIGGVKQYQLPHVADHLALSDCHRQIVGVEMSMKNLGLVK